MPPVHDLATGGHGLVAVKRRVPDQHLVHDRADAPPVALHPVPFLQENLRGDVIRGADGAVRESATVRVPVFQLRGARGFVRRVRGVVAVGVARRRRRDAILFDDLRQRVQHLLVDGFAQTEIAQFHVPVRVQEQVIRFDIAVNEARGVDRLRSDREWGNASS
eukprot:31124-Pelagococcus_subviridis.AAC.4